MLRRNPSSELTKRRISVAVFCLPLLAFAAAAAPTEDGGAKLFHEQVQQVLAKRCFGCHNAQVKQGDLDLSNSKGLLHGGVSGPAVIRGKARESLLYLLINRQKEPAMPFKADALPAETIAQIAAWIDAGASYGEPAPDASHGAFADVRAALETQCLACHGGGKVNRSGFDLANREGLLRGGDNGPAVVPGKSQESALMKRVRHEVNPGMPYQGQKLSAELIARIGAWIDAGAPYDAPLKAGPATISAARRNTHWAFQVPKQPPVPAVKNQAWVRNPIDAFLAAEQEKKGLRPLPEAEKSILLRRVYLDLIGLPPTPEQVKAFVADQRSDAYEKVVDELLASPRYGERWGRHWMDIWRYSDWYGRREGDEQRNSARNIWHWRDWIIESVNQDKGYDKMIVEMLAADEIYPTDPKTLRATGFLARDYYRFNRNVWMQDSVEHTAAAFLGITMKCARCHDHKYDPISQEEYYRFRAFFERYDVRLDHVPGQPDANKDSIARIFDADPREQTKEVPFIPAVFADTYRLIRGDEGNPDKSKALTPAVPEILSGGEIAIKPVSLPLDGYNPDIQPFVGQDLISQAKEDIEKAEKKLADAQKDVAHAKQRLAAPPEVSASAISFEKDIKPIFEQNCTMCHNAKNDKSGLALDTTEAILLGGAINGPAAKRGKSKESPLILYMTGKKKPRMPFSGPPLADEKINLVATWIDQLEEDPAISLKKAEAAVALAEKQLAWMRANLPAVEARIAADRAKYAEPPDPNAGKLAVAAQKVETKANVLKAQADLLRAQQDLAEAQDFVGPEKVRDRRIAAARKAAQEAATALGAAVDGYTPFAKPYPKTSTGRRTALAYWIASKQNPLTARVAINDIWLRHFGKPLVPTVVNFGQNGKPPTNPALLDWLAVQFMQNNWSMKAIHRLMVTSSAYRMRSSDPDPKDPNIGIDAENRYYWRMNPRRMEAEIVRDSVLYLAGQLDLSTGGPDIEESKADDVHRRSLYFRHTPDSQVEFLKLFDQPDPTDCYTRSESIVPQQALALSNSRLSFTEARLLARQISEKIGANPSDADFIVNAFETVLDQPPSQAEREASEKFLQKQTQLLADASSLRKFEAGAAAEVAPSSDPHLRARENLVHALLNHTEFVTIR